ncbi:DUF167 family protein [Pontibacterium granulatum]|uniref:DUF167 family protein n=1 Tax=Pontibacterium granulatum TaxID=2036029 RepID=UPI00249BF392|nr:DUF167 family protein [Pontibacterium granulatum]MDI3324645.1 DUF167 family protein [Pontibacterium granulatum]
MYYQWQNKDLILSCHLQPKATKDEIVGLHGDSLKIRITAPPIDGRANTHLIKFLAKTFGVTKRDITILSGELGRQKRIKIKQPTKIPDILQIDPE